MHRTPQTGAHANLKDIMTGVSHITVNIQEFRIKSAVNIRELMKAQ